MTIIFTGCGYSLTANCQYHYNYKMPRLNQERQAELEPKRMAIAKHEITKLGYEIKFENETQLIFVFNNHNVNYFPYSGWHSGASITDGRGLNKLLKQIR